jgi:hypothetical protein
MDDKGIHWGVNLAMSMHFAVRALVFAAWFLLLPVRAAQIDIHGPTGSGAFGTTVTVLPNGNFVVTDPDGPVSGIGAVYLYSPSGTLISSLYGSTANDHVGRNGIRVIGNNFLVVSGGWHNGAASDAGAVTWVDGTTGFVTGSTSTSNIVSSANSRVGSHNGDFVGTVTVLSNGHYVIQTFHWNGNIGAVSWCKSDGSSVGAVSAANSLTGSIANDRVGKAGVTALSDGNYVVDSPYWSNPSPATAQVGAVTWLDGSGPFSGVVSASNSLIGTTAGDNIGVGGVVALNDGHYVVSSYAWNNGSATQAGAVTWRSGGSASAATVSTGNSLFGTTSNDLIASDGAIALSNGNYVVKSGQWNSGAGAATWGNGASGTIGPVSEANSLIGSNAYPSVVALHNGNYVVLAPLWQNAGIPVGAALLIDGSAPYSSSISTGNALFGTSVGDNVGSGATALSDGNYVVTSSQWNGGTGAATWGNGTTGITGPVLPSNSLTGNGPEDALGSSSALALPDGNYLVLDSGWSNGVTNGSFGAVTWCRAGGSCTGAISAARSLYGTQNDDDVGSAGGRAFSDGNYAILSANWANGGIAQAGAVTLASGHFRLKGTIAPWNSVIGGVANGGSTMTYDYDPTHHRLIVGRPTENIVSLFTMDQVFSDDFDP